MELLRQRIPSKQLNIFTGLFELEDFLGEDSPLFFDDLRFLCPVLEVDDDRMDDILDLLLCVVFLRKELSVDVEVFDVFVSVSDDFGIPDQAREAMAFALMGHESLLGRPSNLPAVTGAKEPVVLGTITMQQL